MLNQYLPGTVMARNRHLSRLDPTPRLQSLQPVDKPALVVTNEGAEEAL